MAENFNNREKKKLGKFFQSSIYKINRYVKIEKYENSKYKILFKQKITIKKISERKNMKQGNATENTKIINVKARINAGNNAKTRTNVKNRAKAKTDIKTGTDTKAEIKVNTGTTVKENHRSKDKVFELAVLAGEILLESGAEITRVEDTMGRIAAAFELENFDSYVLTSGLFASSDGEERTLYSRIKGVPNAGTHFAKIDAVNEISRQVVAHNDTLEHALEEMQQIKNMPEYSAGMHTLGAGLGAGGFCYLLGGTIEDSLFAFLVGFIMWVAVTFLRKNEIKKTLCNILGSVISCGLCIFLHHFGFGDSADKMIIGALIPLIPGVSFVNGIRDFSDNNFLSGMVRFMDVAVVTICMAIGAGFVIEITNQLGGIL